MSPHSPNKGFYWHGYGSKLLFRARSQNGTLEDVNYAIECSDTSLACFPSGHPMRARILLTMVPTGSLSQLPYHVARMHEDSSADSVLDRVMSSYAVSINALRHPRRNPIRQRQKDGPISNRALLVSLRNTPGQMSLPHAEREINTFYGLCPSLNFNTVKPSCTKEGILHHLNQCQIFHFAGHGHSHPRDPFKSYLLLEDWQRNPLAVVDLRESKLQDNPHKHFIAPLQTALPFFGGGPL